MKTKYEKLRDTLRDRARRDFLPGKQFPTQRALMAEYGASLATVDRALRELVAEGVLLRFQGRGTFVNRGQVPSSAFRQIALILTRNVTCYAHTFYAGLLFEICNRLSAEGFCFSYHYLDESSNIRKFRDALCSEGRYAGILMVGNINEIMIGGLEELHLPIVVVDNALRLPGVTYVATANGQGARELVHYLYEAGHRRIGFVSTPLHSSFLERFIGYYHGMFDVGLCPEERHCQRFFVFRKPELLEEMFATAPPTALLCANDAIGGEVCRMLRNNFRLSVPWDVSVAGFDDDPSGFGEWDLTTRHVPRRKMGQLAVELLLKKMRGEPAESVLLETALVERSSVLRTASGLEEETI